ncbi:hypothetical protein [Sphingobacterium sp. UBA6320]|uniref:hypothetical protein n=1 Tax=Sphingobacterium sp. UBA6320 TaxID=1947510 RepID=UPI0025E9C833|nr:hypothetical protein [Sphingobacterium sp. UBA6320]
MKNNVKERAGGFGIDGIRHSGAFLTEIEVEKLKESWKNYVKFDIPSFPENFSGKGIVICGGGIRYFTCAWVNINLLRKNGCELPIELWYTNGELNQEIIDLLKELNVDCKNTIHYSKQEFENYTIKSFAIINSSFREVLFLDADNNSMTDPTFLFDNESYLKTGTLFWPDFWKTSSENAIWKIFECNDFDEFEQESGQLLIDKEKCWSELNLCNYLNQNKDVYYKLLLGDKDTFRFAWKALKKTYSMIRTGVGHCGYSDHANPKFSSAIAMVQHAPSGDVLFIHQNLVKWDIIKTDELLWQSIKRFNNGSTNNVFVQKDVLLPDGSKGIVFDIDGDISTVNCDQTIKNNEKFCLSCLENLRNSAFYHRFILHLYLSRSRNEVWI